MSVITNPLVAGGGGGSGGGGTSVPFNGTSLSPDAATYDGNIIIANNAAAQTITVNTGAGFVHGFTVIQHGAGFASLAGTATFNAANGTSTSGPSTTMTVVATALDTFDVFCNATADRTFVNATAGATPAIDMSKYNVVDLTLSANCTPAFSGAVTGQTYSVTLIIRTGAGGYTFTLPTTKWSGGTPYLITAGASKIDIITMTTDDGGTTWFGFIASQGAS